ncbi:MAG: C69 family dipeptidase [Thermodesulfobacteriota bacterium]
MCDTVVATAEVTADGVALFGKNSDREPNEAHQVVRIPAADHSPGSRVRCTYIDLPQVPHTHALLLAKPFWIWGAEMGANDQGVVIGNEAVFTRVPYEKGNALIGMDFLRLALERASCAHDAVIVITDLLAEYGQGGNCGLQHKLFYHNSFLIADPKEAWVLETAGPHWATKKVKGVYAISNGLTISREWDLASPDLVNHAVQKGWCKGRDDFDFARCYSDFLYTKFSDCRRRCMRTTELLTSHKGTITVADMMAALRDHGRQRNKGLWRPDQGITGADVCMHAGFGPIRVSQTTGSMISLLHPTKPTHFITATAAPCTSIFKPLWLENPWPDMGPVPGSTYDQAALFWRHEALHRTTLRDYPTLMTLYKEERDNLEKEFIAQAFKKAAGSASKRMAYTSHCFAEAGAAEERWLERVSKKKIPDRRNFLYSLAWNRINRQARMPA